MKLLRSISRPCMKSSTSIMLLRVRKIWIVIFIVVLLINVCLLSMALSKHSQSYNNEEFSDTTITKSHTSSQQRSSIAEKASRVKSMKDVTFVNCMSLSHINSRNGLFTIDIGIGVDSFHDECISRCKDFKRVQTSWKNVVIDSNSRTCYCGKLNSRGVIWRRGKMPNACARNRMPLYLINHHKKVIRRVEDQRCGIIELAPLHTYKKQGLASLPGSGNTWMRHLVELLSGVFTGSEYHDSNLYQKGFLGEMKSIEQGIVILIKSHLSQDAHIYNKHGGAILLIRNPFRATVADFQRRFRGKDGSLKGNSHTQTLSREDFKKEIFGRFANEQTRFWYEINTTFLKVVRNLLVVHYEDMKTNLAVQLRRVIKFLNLDVSAERFNCTLENSQGSFKRKSNDITQDATFDPFSESIKNVTRGYIKEVSELLRLKRQPDIPDIYWLYS